MHMHVIGKPMKHEASQAPERACFRTNHNHTTFTQHHHHQSFMHSFIHSFIHAHSLFWLMAADADVVCNLHVCVCVGSGKCCSHCWLYLCVALFILFAFMFNGFAFSGFSVCFRVSFIFNVFACFVVFVCVCV